MKAPWVVVVGESCARSLRPLLDDERPAPSILLSASSSRSSSSSSSVFSAWLQVEQTNRSMVFSSTGKLVALLSFVSPFSFSRISRRTDSISFSPNTNAAFHLDIGDEKLYTTVTNSWVNHSEELPVVLFMSRERGSDFDDSWKKIIERERERIKRSHAITDTDGYRANVSIKESRKRSTVRNGHWEPFSTVVPQQWRPRWPHDWTRRKHFSFSVSYPNQATRFSFYFSSVELLSVSEQLLWARTGAQAPRSQGAKTLVCDWQVSLRTAKDVTNPLLSLRRALWANNKPTQEKREEANKKYPVKTMTRTSICDQRVTSGGQVDPNWIETFIPDKRPPPFTNKHIVTHRRTDWVCKCPRLNQKVKREIGRIDRLIN